jgi:hypothetical protein
MWGLPALGPHGETRQRAALLESAAVWRRWGAGDPADAPNRPDLLKAIARAYRWWGMLEHGVYASITELAAAEKINQSYVCRVLRLTLLAPTHAAPC